MNRELTIVAFALLLSCANARAEFVDREGILRKDNGSILGLNQVEARAACERHGKRLPTVRNLVKSYLNAGMELKEPADATEDDIHVVPAVDSDGVEDRFFYNNDQYQAPQGILGELCFWSSSTVKEFADFGYYFCGENGVVDGVFNTHYQFAVRCFDAHQ